MPRVITIPERIERAMVKQRIKTQTELARRTGIDQADLSRVLSGKQALGLKRAMRLGKVLRISYTKLIISDALPATDLTPFESDALQPAGAVDPSAPPPHTNHGSGTFQNQ